MNCDVLVIGAGPGGCAVALAMKRAGWQVVLAERRSGPADKLCGEFLSPDGVESLGRLGMGEVLAGFPQLGQVLISSISGQCWQALLPAAGVGSNRRRLDTLLLDRCASAGVEVLRGVRVRRVEGSLGTGFSTQLEEGRLGARLVVGAWGRQGGVKPQAGSRGGLMAIKAHGRGRGPGVELHSFPGGYAGICQVGENEMNLCLLARAEAFRRAGGEMQRFSTEVMGKNPLLATRLSEVAPDWGQAVAAANLSFGPAATQVDDILMVGDASGAIAPFCGDGMAMALRAGELLAPLGDGFLRGALSGPALLAQYGRGWRGEFSYRLRIGGLLQRALMYPAATELALGLLRSLPWLGPQLFCWTRGR